MTSPSDSLSRSLFRALFRPLLLLVYSLMMTFLRPFLGVLAFVSPKLKAQTKGREPVPELAKKLGPLRARHQRSVLFFCSSAGEYEQARPLIERLGTSVFVHVIFFSKSGLDYMHARRDNVSASLAPLGDSTWEWGWLLSALRPNLTVVVRHELWPAFLDAAKSYGRLHLIAASRSQGESTSRLKRFARTQLLDNFDVIHAVNDADARFFHETYGVPTDHLRVSGDPKYDRVIERAAAKAGEAAKIKALFDAVSAGQRRLVLGSTYEGDVDVCLAARAKIAPETAKAWQLVLAPHDISPEMIKSLHAACAKAGLSAISYTDLVGSPPKASTTWQVVILDTMGMLAEVYGAGDAAFVGGALHRQVHNVLEPACRGLALGYGPFYKNSQEAVRLVEAGLATVIRDAGQFATWWQGLETGLTERAAATRRAVEDLAGATDRILSSWRPILEGSQLPPAPRT